MPYCMTKVEAAMMRMVDAAGTDDLVAAHLAFVDAAAEDEAYWGSPRPLAPIFQDGRP